MKFMIFCDFLKFLVFWKILLPFLRPSENTNETNAFLMILETIFRKNHLFRKNGEIPQNSTHFAKFHLISWNFMIFIKFWCFGASEGSFCDLSCPTHAFKAKKVTFWEVCSDFAWFSLFSRKIDFPWNFMKFCKNSISGPQKLFFRPWASKKAPRTLCLWRVLRRGLQGRILGAKEGFWAPKPQNGQNFMFWGQKGEACLPKGWMCTKG